MVSPFVCSLKSEGFQRRLAKVFLLCVMMVLCFGCATSTSSFTNRKQGLNLPALETELKRGVSTTADVERWLGKPDGIGSALGSTLFQSSLHPHVVWFYDKLDISLGKGKVDVRQDGALIFFQGDVLDGFLWFSEAGGDR